MVFDRSSRGRGRGGSFRGRGGRGGSRGGHEKLNRYQQKTKEIEKSLIHRARLRKAYFKILEKEEGVNNPQKLHSSVDDESNEREDIYDNGKGRSTKKDIENKSKKDSEEENDSEDDGENQNDREDGKDNVDDTTTAGYRQTFHHHHPDRARRLTFAEKSQLIKERKKQKLEERKERILKQQKEREEKERLRSKRSKQMSKFNKKGQPIMGPRINILLDKIKETM